MGKLSKVAYTIVIIVVILALVAEVRALGSPFYVVSSGSMVPTLNVGDVIVVEPTPFKSVKVGNIIVFKEPGFPNRVIVHRVIKIVYVDGERAFITKGDHNLYRDPWIVKKEQYIGKVVFTIPYAGSLSLVLRPPVNYVIIVILIVVIIIGELIPSEKKSQV